jgi:Rrf2 family protein
MHLSSLPSGKTVQAVDIAEANNIPKKFLDAILGEFRDIGVVRSKKGPGGGQVLARPADDIQIGRVIHPTDLSPRSPARAAPRFASAMIARTSGPAQYARRSKR